MTAAMILGDEGAGRVSIFANPRTDSFHHDIIQAHLIWV